MSILGLPQDGKEAFLPGHDTFKTHSKLIDRSADNPEGDPSRSVTGVEERPKGDRIYQPGHYAKWELEPITFLIVNKVPFAEGNVIKYVMRWRDKNGIEDLKKAMRYLEMLIEFEENKEDYLPKKKIL